MYKLHLLQHPAWHRTGTSYCYFYIFEIIHHDIVFFIFVFLKIKKSFLKSSRPSLPLKKAISKTYPSFLTVKEGSTSHLGLLPSGKKRETALLGARDRYALRLADHQRSSPYYAGWDRLSSSPLQYRSAHVATRMENISSYVHYKAIKI